MPERPDPTDRPVHPSALSGWSEIYTELHGLAEGYFRRQPRDHTLQPTALVNEAYLKLSAAGTRSWENRAHFFRTAAKAMRQILIDHARRRRLRQNYVDRKIGEAGQFPPTDPVDHALELICLDESLERLSSEYPRESEVVELRYFGGLTVEQTAEALEISLATVGRDWAFARAWLRADLSGGSAPGPPG